MNSPLGDFLRNVAEIIDKNGGQAPKSLSEIVISDKPIRNVKRINKKEMLRSHINQIANSVFKKHGIDH